MEPGKPLSFLEHRIQCGNSLLGATPALLSQGIPDEAFTPIEGDDKEICKEFKRINKDERNKQMRLFAATTEPWLQLGNFAASLMNLDTVGDDSIEAIREKERMYEEAVRSGDYLDGRFWADTWCAAFVWKKTREFSYPITEEVFRRIERNPHACEPWMRHEIERLAMQYRFFHWHFAFPDIFRFRRKDSKPDSSHTGWKGGFDVVLGNPPWDKIQPEEVKFFASVRLDIAQSENASERRQLIESLRTEDPMLADRWEAYRREINSVCHLLRDGKLLRLTSDGNLNTFRLFAELGTKLISNMGLVGMVVQTGLATDEQGKEFFAALLSRGQLVRFLDFENREGFFPDVDSRFRFALATFCGAGIAHKDRSAEFGWLLQRLSDLDSQHLIRLTSSDIALFNPSSATCPVFQSKHDLEINRTIYAAGRHICLDDDRRFGQIDFLGELFNMTRDSRFFHREPTDHGSSLPLYEAKYVHQFDHRYASFSSAGFSEVPTDIKADPSYRIVPKNWVPKTEVLRRLLRRNHTERWLLGFRSVASATNERTAIFSVLPLSGVGHNMNLVLGLLAQEALLLCANCNSFVFDFACRQKMSGMNFNIWIMKQLPAIPLTQYADTSPGLGRLGPWVCSRALELTYTACDLQPFAVELAYDGAPFRWDEGRRFLLRCELDALYFRLYGISHEDAAYILDTFHIVRRKDEAAYGEYRTKRVILEVYDAMAEAERTGVPYQTRLDPPPGDPRVAHEPHPADAMAKEL